VLIGELLERRRIREQVPILLEKAGEEDLADVFRATHGSKDLVAALGDQLVAVADALEQAAITPDLDVSSPLVMDFATALRVGAGGEARRGEPLEWEQVREDWWITVDPRGVEWEVSLRQLGWGVIVARWDRPDWYAATCEEAKALAEELAVRPDFPPEVQEPEWFGED
jgi:hypothetical protein